MNFKHLLLGALLLGANLLRAENFVLVANPSVSEASVSAEDLKNILLGNKTRWSSGTVKLVIQPDSSLHGEIVKTYTQRSSDQFDNFWKKLVFSGRGTMPAKAKSDAETIDYVSKNPGAFGYVAPASVTSAVKTISVN